MPLEKEYCDESATIRIFNDRVETDAEKIEALLREAAEIYTESGEEINNDFEYEKM